MPNWLRLYTFHELKKYYDEENKAVEEAQQKAQSKQTSNSSKLITPPDFTAKKGA